MREPGSKLPIPVLYLQDCVVRTTVSERDRSEIPIELWLTRALVAFTC